MDFEFFERARELAAAGQPFVIATVVRVEKPTSARPGARAIIDLQGELTGWVGGSCAEPVVRRAARQALQDGQPRLLRLTPPEKRSQSVVAGVTEIPLACASGGTLEIFIEPQLPQARLVVIGHLPVAQSLAGLGKSLGFGVLVAGVEADPERFPQADRVVNGLDFSQLGLRPGDYVVVASHGNYDEEALTGALEAQAAYVALVASKARGQAILEYLRGSGYTEEQLARLKFPAGLDLGAATPAEIALSILAEIVQLRRKPVGREPVGREPVGAGLEAEYPSSHGNDRPAPGDGMLPIRSQDDNAMQTTAGNRTETTGRAGVIVPEADGRIKMPVQWVENGPVSTPAPTSSGGSFDVEEARDPVCGMTVEVASARYKSEFNGETYYFCAPSCKRSFEADPQKYLEGKRVS